MLRTKLRYPSSQPSHKGGSDDDNKVINVDENDEDDEEQEDQDLEADKKEEDLTETRRSKKLSLPPLPLSLPSSRAFSTREKVVGLKDAGTLSSSWKARRNEFLRNSCVTNVSTDTIAIPKTTSTTIEDKEKNARDKENRNPFSLLLLGNLAALKVMVLYLISLETIITCSLTAWLIIFWYQLAQDHEGKGQKWTGGSMDFIILAFAVISPIATAIGMAFTRREGALVTIADMRSFAHHLYLAHCLWDWPENGGRAGCHSLDLLEHCDAVMAQLVGIGDELSRFLTLPTTSRSRHRMTRQGRREAARTVEVAYRLLESMVTQRMTRLSIYAERIKTAGLSAGEVSRIRQYERFLHNSIERLRMYKMYRTPQALRSFARIFTFLLPPFYAPKFAQVAIDLDSLAIGLTFGIITTIGLTALFESLQVMEDPFVGYLTLDGIDVREEFEVLMWSSLVKTRRIIFPDAPVYPLGRRAALSVVSTDHHDRLVTKPSIIEVNTPGNLSARASSHVDTASRRDLQASSIGGGVKDEDSDFFLADSKGMIPTTSDLSLLTTQTNSLRPGREEDEEAAEFGYPILEDPESEEFLRQTSFRHDGGFGHHKRSKSARSTSSLVGLVWRNNGTASPQRSQQQL